MANDDTAVQPALGMTSKTELLTFWCPPEYAIARKQNNQTTNETAKTAIANRATKRKGTHERLLLRRRYESDAAVLLKQVFGSSHSAPLTGARLARHFAETRQ